MLRAIFAMMVVLLVAGCETPDGLVLSRSSFLPDMEAKGAVAVGALVVEDVEQTEKEVTPLVFANGAYRLTIEESGSKPPTIGHIRISTLPEAPDYGIGELSLNVDEDAEENAPTHVFALIRKQGAGYELLTFSSEEVMKKGAISGLTFKTKADKKTDFTASTSTAMYGFFNRATQMIQSGELGAGTLFQFEIVDTSTPGTLERLQAESEALKIAKEERKAAKARQTKQDANKDKWFGKWLFTLSEDAITDERKLYVYGRPDGVTDWDTGPWLRIGCYAPDAEYPMGLTLMWRETLGEVDSKSKLTLTRVTSRLDKNAPKDMVWVLGESGQETYPPGPYAKSLKTEWITEWTAKQMHDDMRTAKRVVFRGYPDSGQPVTLIFDLQGYTDAIQNFEPHCNK